MTVEQEIKTLTTVCRLLQAKMENYDIHEFGSEQQNTRTIRSLLDSIDAADDEPETPVAAKCTHENHACYHGRVSWYEMFVCSMCKRMGRKIFQENQNPNTIEWWPEGGSK